MSASLPSSPSIRVVSRLVPVERGSVDLHIHSNLSDGELSVEQILETALRRKLTAIAITDHDSIDSWWEGKGHAARLGVRLLPGVEISCSESGSDIHILGYFFDPTNIPLNLALKKARRRRTLRARAMVRKLNRLGLPLRFERVRSLVTPGTSIGRPHIAQALIQEELADSYQEAFDKWLGADAPAYVASESPDPLDAVALLTQAGGVAVMAHPHKTCRDDLIPALVRAGMVGIEIDAHQMGSSARRHYAAIARMHGLVGCGGSDSHGERPGQPGIGAVRLPESVLDRLLEVRDRHAAKT